MFSFFRSRPYGRLQRQLDDARHSYITETAKAEDAAAKAALAKAQISRLEGWIAEMEAEHKDRQDARPYPRPYPEEGWNRNGPVIPRRPEPAIQA